MTLQASGLISLQNLATEYGGSQPHALSEYYRGQGNVPNIVQDPYTGYDPYQGYNGGLNGVKRREMTSGSNNGTFSWVWWWDGTQVSTNAPGNNNIISVGPTAYQWVTNTITTLGTGTDKNGDSYEEKGYKIGKFRTTYRDVLANKDVPNTVGDPISFDDFYGGRKT